MNIYNGRIYFALRGGDKMKHWFQSFHQKYLDISIKTSNDHITRIVERPGLWMTQDELDDLSGNLKTIASNTLPEGSLNYGVFSAKRQSLNNSIITLICTKKDNKPIAFNALAIMELDINGKQVDVIHLGLVMIDPNEQSKGLSWVLYGLTCCIMFFRQQFRPLIVSNVSQVPAIIGMVSETFNNVFPQPDIASERNFSKILMARKIMQEHRHVFGVGQDAMFNENKFIIQNAYTGGSEDLKKAYQKATKHRDEKYNIYCEELLDYERGDDFLQLGQMDIYSTKRYLTRNVPRKSFMSIASISVFIFLKHLILPALYWSNSNKQYGILRPWKT